MDQGRFEKIDQVLEAVLGVEPSERADFLKRACDGDDELLREIERLLSREKEAAQLEVPAIAYAAEGFAEQADAVFTGHQISHFVIKEWIGAGGMGEVWQAWDEQVERDVAIKILPTEFTVDAERVGRFKQEAFAVIARCGDFDWIEFVEQISSNGYHPPARPLLGDAGSPFSEEHTMSLTHLKRGGFFAGIGVALGFMAMHWLVAAISAQSSEQTMEQKYKNIQILKGQPASQLRPMMNYISASLGVSCESCHVKNGDNWEFDKDDKKNKQTARKMIQMTMDLNKNSFEGKMEVSCVTCHHGMAHPASIPPLPRVMPKPETKPTEPWPTPQQILAKYTQAIGGNEAVEKIKSRSIKGVSVAGNGQSFPLEIIYASPDKMSLSVSLPQGATASKLNGSQGWLKNAREDRAMESPEIARIKSLAWSLEPLQLKEPYPRLAFGGVEKIGERECLILRMALPDKRRVRFFFDKESGLLVRRIIQTETIIGIDPEQTDYDDYRDVDGVKVPFTIRTTYLDNFNSSTRKFTEIKNNAAIESSQFTLPAGKQ